MGHFQIVTKCKNMKNTSLAILFLSLIIMFLVVHYMKNLTEEHFAVLNNLDEDYALWNPENTDKYIGPNETDKTLNMWQYSPFSSLVQYKYYKLPYNETI